MIKTRTRTIKYLKAAVVGFLAAKQHQEGKEKRRKIERKAVACLRPVRECLLCGELGSCRLVTELMQKRQQAVREVLPAAQPAPVHPKNNLNELSGAEWLYFTKTLLSTAYPSEYGHALRKAHGANKPPRLMKQLIEFFTKRGESVLDPFAGVGGTLIGAALCQFPRDCLGIEINPQWVGVYHQVLAAHPELASYPLVAGDCREILRDYPDNHFHFITTDPPYNTHFTRTMCTGKYETTHPNRKTDYDMQSDDVRDLANLESYDAYLAAMTGVLAARARLAGFIPKGEIIWYQAGTRLRPYGYPYAYVPNIAHQYILVLQKPKARGKK